MKNNLNTENTEKSKTSPKKLIKSKNSKMKKEISNKPLNNNTIIKKDKINNKNNKKNGSLNKNKKNDSLNKNDKNDKNDKNNKNKKNVNLNKSKNNKTKDIIQKNTMQFYSEHYDLPNTYEKTYLVLVAQNPNTLFAFWEISELDKQKLKEKYGSNLFQNTKPILTVINKTLSTNFEIEINEFATNWYIDIDHSNCEYEVQLGLKPYNNLENEFILITNSNSILCPNDNILFEELPKNYEFFNIESKIKTSKKIEANNFKKLYNIYDFYLKDYVNEFTNNPSSKMNNTNFN
ncbi:MAG TPA: DUF4912 domain-containing protein [Clostridia bacterium]|nr:DUF4912 domain-containing protein [Clostridia bacterium]